MITLGGTREFMAAVVVIMTVARVNLREFEGYGCLKKVFEDFANSPIREGDTKIVDHDTK